MPRRNFLLLFAVIFVWAGAIFPQLTNNIQRRGFAFFEKKLKIPFFIKKWLLCPPFPAKTGRNSSKTPKSEIWTSSKYKS
jgi:hypothetical protein